MALRRSRIVNLARLGSSTASKQSIVRQVEELFPIWRANRQRMMVIDAWHRAALDENMLPIMPDKATHEFKKIREKSPTPWGFLIVNSMSQVMVVDDIKMADADKSAPAFRIWQRNLMDSRQIPLHNSMLTFGPAYNVVLPATGRLDGEKTASMRGKSALRALGFYRDDFDEYPEFLLEGEEQRNSDGTIEWILVLTDDVAQHRLSCDLNGSNMKYIEDEPHGMDVCPVVRYCNSIDLDGRVVGEIAPFISLFGRIDQDTQDRLVVQRFGAWAVRTIAGMETPATDADKQAARIALGVGDFMVSPDPKTQFGSLPGTPLDGFIRSREADIRDLSAVSQVPAHQFLGLSDNAGAEGLAAADASMYRKRDQRRTMAGESHEGSLRLAGYAAGIPEVARDFESRVHWKNTDTYSFQSLAQALGILATQLGIPPEMLWAQLPDWTQLDTAQAKKLIEELQVAAQLDAEIAQQQAVEIAAAGRAAAGANPAAAQ